LSRLRIRRKTQVDLTAADEQLKIYGVDKDHPRPIVDVYAPITGVVVAQNVTNAAAGAFRFPVRPPHSPLPICPRCGPLRCLRERYCEAFVGQEAKIKLNAYPDRVLTGHISDIGPVLDPPSAPRRSALSLVIRDTQARHVRHGYIESRTKNTYPVVPRMRFFTCMTRMGLCACWRQAVQAHRSDRGQDVARQQATRTLWDCAWSKGCVECAASRNRGSQ